MSEKWIVVGTPTALDTTEKSGVVLHRKSDPFVPIKNAKFKKALAEGKLSKVKVETEPMMTKAEYLAKKSEERAKKNAALEAKREAASQIDGGGESTPDEAGDEESSAVDEFESMGLSKKVSAKLVEAGFKSIGDLDEADDEQLLDIGGIGASTVSFIRDALKG